MVTNIIGRTLKTEFYIFTLRSCFASLISTADARRVSGKGCQAKTLLRRESLKRVVFNFSQPGVEGITAGGLLVWGPIQLASSQPDTIHTRHRIHARTGAHTQSDRQSDR